MQQSHERPWQHRGEVACLQQGEQSLPLTPSWVPKSGCRRSPGLAQAGLGGSREGQGRGDTPETADAMKGLQLNKISLI